MHAAFRSVARGLRLTNIGFLLACWASAVALGMFWLIDRDIVRSYYIRSNEVRYVFIGLFFASLAAIVAGVIVGFVGRIRCLRTPAEFPAVRGRALAAIVLEGSGWGSLLVGIGVMCAMGFRWLPSAPWVPAIGMGFSGLLILCGRILFLRFLRVLGRVVEDKTSARRARFSLTLFLADWGAGLVGVGVMAGGGALGMEELTYPLAYLIWIAAGMSGLGGLILYDRLLGNLARSVQAFAESFPSEDDEPEQNRSRVDEGEDADSQEEPTEATD
jgi:hypothetical protein